MGMHIELDNPNRSYFPGQVVSGRVVIQNDNPDKVKQVKILLHGRGRVHWTEQQSGAGVPAGYSTNYMTTVNYTAEEDYAKIQNILAGDGETPMMLPQATTSYPFSFLLPTTLPSSFHSKIGQVSYILRGEVKKPSFFKLNDKVKLPFTVNGIFDLNLQHGAELTQECRQTKGTNFWIGRTGKLNLFFSLPSRSGFVPGEAIDFRANITNGTNQKLACVKASLRQVTNFYAKRKCKTKKILICEIYGPEVGQGENRVWEGSLLIPEIPPTKLGGSCQIIDLQYFIYVEVSTTGLGCSRKGKLPVMIGTIPLKSTLENLQTGSQGMLGMGIQPISTQGHTGFGLDLPNSTLEPIIPSTSQAIIPPQRSSVIPSAPLLHEYPDIPPPSYSEAVGSPRVPPRRSKRNLF